jgi:carboxymethylenebutenolidase
MREFQVNGRTFSGYLAEPSRGSGPGVLVLHAWWGLTEPFQRVCDQLAEAGFVALALDLYRGKTATTVEEAQTLGEALDQEFERVRGDIAAAVQFLRQHAAQLSLFLGQHSIPDEVLDWVPRAKDESC